MSPSKQKEEIRKTVLAKRDALSLEFSIEMSLKAVDLGFDALLELSEVVPGQVVSGYFPIRSEFDPRPLMDAIRRVRARLCLPAVIDKETIVFRELLRTNELVDTGFGTRGPPETSEILDPDILLMPLSAFDSDGNRIGYGAGHYDRAIARLIEKGGQPILIGVAFDCQEVDVVPHEVHDKPLRAIITETGFRQFRKKG